MKHKLNERNITMSSTIRIREDGLVLRYTKGRCLLGRSNGTLATYSDRRVAEDRCAQLVAMGYDATVVEVPSMSFESSANNYRISIGPDSLAGHVPPLPKAAVIYGMLVDPRPYEAAKAFFRSRGYASVSVLSQLSAENYAREAEELRDHLHAEGYMVTMVELTRERAEQLRQTGGLAHV